MTALRIPTPRDAFGLPVVDVPAPPAPGTVLVLDEMTRSAPSEPRTPTPYVPALVPLGCHGRACMHVPDASGESWVQATRDEEGMWRVECDMCATVVRAYLEPRSGAVPAPVERTALDHAARHRAGVEAMSAVCAADHRDLHSVCRDQSWCGCPCHAHIETPQEERHG